jgi:uncharacterized protein (TIGR00369 family)
MTDLRQRSYEWTHHRVLAEGAKGLSGLAFLQKIVDGSLPAPAISATLRFKLVSVSDGQASFEGTPSEEQYNPMGGVHGGWASTLLDSAMGCAVLSKLDAQNLFTTVQLSINLTRAITEDTGVVRCEGRVIQAGRRVALADGRVVDARGSLLAHATTTCMIIPRLS